MFSPPLLTLCHLPSTSVLTLKFASSSVNMYGILTSMCLAAFNFVISFTLHVLLFVICLAHWKTKFNIHYYDCYLPPYYLKRSRDNRYGLDSPGSNPSTRKRLSLVQKRPDCLWTHLASCTVDTGIFSLRLKRSGCDLNNSSPSTDKVKI